MAAGATPTIYDPKLLFRDSDVTNSDTTQYTAPAEAGVRLTAAIVVNKTTSAITLKFWRETSGGTIIYICYDMSVPGTGAPVRLPVEGICLDASEELHTNAGAATGLDMFVDGIELKD